MEVRGAAGTTLIEAARCLVFYAGCGVARIGRARISIVDVDGRVADARGRVARVSGALVVVVDADRRVRHAFDRIAAVGRANVVVIDRRRRSGNAIATAVARRNPVANVVVVAAGTGGDEALLTGAGAATLVRTHVA